MTATWLNPGEHIVKEGRTMLYIDKVRAFPAVMTLTNERLRVESQGNPVVGLLKVFFKKEQDPVVLDAVVPTYRAAVEKFWGAERLVITLPSGEIRRVLVDKSWKDAMQIS